MKWQRKGKGRRVSVDGRDSDDWVAVDLGENIIQSFFLLLLYCYKFP